MTRWQHPDGPRDYSEVGEGAPEPYDGEPTWLPGQLDALDALEDTPPTFTETRAYYDGPDGTPCPVCEDPKPQHRRGCYEAPDYGPTYRLTPADFQEFR